MRTALVVVLLCASPVSAQLDAGLDRPYRLQVVLDVAGNRVLTPLFQDQLQRDVRDQLALSLGKLAQVEVVRSHPLLRVVQERGLEAGLEGLDVLDEHKVHFVFVDFTAGRYEIRTRQYDGLTGLASPVVRQGATSDRALVASLAAGLVEQDFGLVGTVQSAEKDVTLGLRGAGLASDVSRWLAVGDVFTISRITQENGRWRGRRVNWALLEVLEMPRQGLCRCRLWKRYQEDALRPEPGVVGYRCLKLTTITAPLRLRLVDQDTFGPLENVQIDVPTAKKKIELVSDRNGMIVSREAFARFALVRVMAGEVVRAQLPIPLVDNRAVVCQLKGGADADAFTSWELRKDQWLGRLYDNIRLYSEQMNLLNPLLARSLEEALAQAKQHQKILDEELLHLKAERDHLQRLARDKKMPPARADLREGEQRLTGLQLGQKSLHHLVARLEEVLKQSPNDKELGLAGMLERARLLEMQANYDQAITLYTRIIEVSPDQEKIKTHLQQLKKSWTPRDDRHAKARTFIHDEWARLQPGELGPHIDKVRDAWNVCRQAEDRLSARKLLLTNIVHTANLKKQLDTLRRSDNEDSRARVQSIGEVAQQLKALHSEVADFLKAAGP